MINYYNMNGCDTKEDFRLRLEAIQYFKTLIDFRRSSGKQTKMVNFAGHVGRHMRKDVRQWFVNLYPNTGDYVKFFIENEHDFDYNQVTGEVKLANDKSKFKKPSYLTQLESKACEERIGLSELSSVMHEFECFHKSFTLLKDSASQNEDSVSVKQLLESVEQIESNGIALKAIDKLFENEQTIRGNNRLVHYLMEYYSTIFKCDHSCAQISLTSSTVEQLMKATKQIDDTIYVILRPLLIQFLLKYGAKDVDVLQDCISMRHKYIMEYLFRDSDDYSLFDFVLSNSDDFTYKRVVNDDNTASRMIIPNARHELNNIDNSNHNNSHSSQSFIADNNNSNAIMDLSQQFIQPSFPESIDDESVNKLNTKNDIMNASQQNGDTNHCCVCQMDGDSQLSSKLMDFSEFKQFVKTHELCFMRRLIIDLKVDAEKRHRKSNCVAKVTQTYSTGNIVARI